MNDYELSKVDLVFYFGVLFFVLVGGYLLLCGFIEYVKVELLVSKLVVLFIVDDDLLFGVRVKMVVVEWLFLLCLVGMCMVLLVGGLLDDVLVVIEVGKCLEFSKWLIDDVGFFVFFVEVLDIEVDVMMERLVEEIGVIC